MKKEAMRHLLWLAGLLAVIIIAGAIWGGRVSEQYEEAAQQASEQAAQTTQEPAQEAPAPAGPSCPATPVDWIPKGSYLQPLVNPEDKGVMKCECDSTKFASRVPGANTTGCDAISCVCKEDPATIQPVKRGKRMVTRTPITMNNTVLLNMLNVDEDICLHKSGRIVYRNDMKADGYSCTNTPNPDDVAANKKILRDVNAVINASGAGQTKPAVEAYHNVEPFANDYASCY